MGYKGNWEPDFQYGYGDIVTFQGLNYIIIQPHRSQSDWSPPITPALWGRTSEGGHEEKPYCAPPPCDYKPKNEQCQDYTPHDPKHEAGPVGGYTAPGGVDVHQEETKKPWYDLDEDKKKKLLIGGGLTLGLAAIGGAFYAHKKHEKNEADKEKFAWAAQNWIVDAHKRTELFFRNGPRGPVTWIFYDSLAQHQELEEHLIVGGDQNGRPWYIARAQHNGGLRPGKCNPDVGAFIGYEKESIQVKQYEILIGNKNSIHWVKASGRLEVQKLGFQPVEGGRDENGQELFVIRSHASGGLHPGHAGNDGAFVTVEEEEISVKEYEVLCLRR